MATQYKTIHLIRHAQGYHNLARTTLTELRRLILFGGWRTIKLGRLLQLLSSIWLSILSRIVPSYRFDASLTPTGWLQVEKCRQMVVASGLASKIGLVVVSPMTRTLQTAAGVFGEREIYDDNGEAKPILMKKGKTNPCTRAKPSTKSPPFVAQELCREHIVRASLSSFSFQSLLMSSRARQAHSAAHRRRDISSYSAEFPGIDFSLVQHDQDVLWRPGVEESLQEMQERAKAFFQWLMSREEKEMAVVSHSYFLHEFLRAISGSSTSDLGW
ncbi:phosphoglycerate mutase-like protein [Selaginella moellendorffii]|uniref:phosphoglycerate mutase-like protein n=1 Tax=Selaginella moellendorffii TaxID=88036 RepID=UPI000D1C6111|nr:phosphoglycerate mutase-like protein [Selaginella moellendorffii]|eukprot:XP_024545075.1 phosphoglycerate mutase-like protein [Selaginella moellendorffii]